MSENPETEHIVRVHLEDGSLWAEVVDLPGCFATGDTLDELWEALQEAISLYMEHDPDAREISSVQEASEEGPVVVGRVDEMRVRVPA